MKVSSTNLILGSITEQPNLSPKKDCMDSGTGLIPNPGTPLEEVLVVLSIQVILHCKNLIYNI